MDSPLNRRIASVARATADDSGYNTLVLAGVNVEFPLEIDLDDDYAEERMRLRGLIGEYDVTLCATDSRVRRDPDHPVLYFTFELVPPGRYELRAALRDQWVTVASDLRILPSGVLLGGAAVSGNSDLSKLGTPAPATPSDAEPNS
jgi:hypothetical protein